jgi:hypothetical protein
MVYLLVALSGWLSAICIADICYLLFDVFLRCTVAWHASKPMHADGLDPMLWLLLLLPACTVALCEWLSKWYTP